MDRVRYNLYQSSKVQGMQVSKPPLLCMILSAACGKNPQRVRMDAVMATRGEGVAKLDERYNG